MYDVAVIGAGVIGSFIARELSKYTLKVVLIEKENDFASGTTKANTAIIHSGYDDRPGTLKAELNVKGNSMFDKICRDLNVPFKRVGSLVVAYNEEEMETLRTLFERGKQNNILDMRILNRGEILKKEPNINEGVLGALYAPSAGIIGPWELTFALVENAIENDVEIMLNSEVQDIKKFGEEFSILFENESIRARYIVNAGGLYADRINSFVSKNIFEITPRRGEYILFDKSVGGHVNTVIFQRPIKNGKGVVILPTVHGNLLIGPTAENVQSKELLGTTRDGIEKLIDHSKNLVQNLPLNKIITAFSGLRAKTSSGDFIIEESKDAKGFINVAAIDSPGLSAAPAIAAYVVDILHNISGGIVRKVDFKEQRKPYIPFMSLEDEEKNEIIKRNPKYGKVICRCENITEGEIIEAINRKAGATTVDGVKKRVRAGAGRCQGSFCCPKVMEIIAKELNINIKDVVKDRVQSYILTEETKKKYD